MATTTTTEITTKKPKIPPLSQLCWNCKRAVNSENFKCPWADKGIPIKGWTAAPNTVKQGGRKDIDTYYVTNCPLYVQDKPWGCDYSTALIWLAKELNYSVAYVRRNYQRMLNLYEEIYDKKLPLWMFEKEYETDSKKSSVQRRKK